MSYSLRMMRGAWGILASDYPSTGVERMVLNRYGNPVLLWEPIKPDSVIRFGYRHFNVIFRTCGLKFTDLGGADQERLMEDVMALARGTRHPTHD